MRIEACLFFWMTAGMLVRANSLLHFTFGSLEKERGNLEQAEQWFEKAYADDPTALPLIRLEADRLFESGDRKGAIGAYRRAIKASPQSFPLQLEYGDFLGKVGRGDPMAEKLQEVAYGKALSQRPGDFLAVERLIRLYRELGRDEDARKRLPELALESEEAVRYFIATTSSLYSSDDAAAKGRIEEAYAAGLSRFPESAALARSASDYFKEAGDLSRAIEILRSHVSQVPSSLDLKIRLGVLLFSAREYEEGVRILEGVLETHPGKAVAHQSLAKYYRLQGMPEKARPHAAGQLKLQGGSPDEFLNLAAELLDAREFREARLLLEKAVFFHPENAQLLMKLAVATAQDPESADSASKIFERAEKLLGKGEGMEPDFVLESAAQLVAIGRQKEAEDRLRAAIRNFPKENGRETALALRALAKIWKDAGKNQEAAQALIQRAEALEK